jgi:hypothetical protein
MRSCSSHKYRACASSEPYQKELKKQYKYLMEEVDLILGFANAQRNERWVANLRRFEAQIAKPAAELANAMGCSPEDYEW